MALYLYNLYCVAKVCFSFVFIENNMVHIYFLHHCLRLLIFPIDMQCITFPLLYGPLKLLSGIAFIFCLLLHSFCVYKMSILSPPNINVTVKAICCFQVNKS